MIEKRLRNIFRLGGLIGVRQGYKLTRNWYQIYYEPELVIRELRETRDKSQIFLILVTALAPLFLYVAARVIYDLWKYRGIVLITGSGLSLALGLEVVILGYLFFGIMRVWWEDRNGNP